MLCVQIRNKANCNLPLRVFSRGWHRLRFFPLLSPVPRFSRLATVTFFSVQPEFSGEAIRKTPHPPNQGSSSLGRAGVALAHSYGLKSHENLGFYLPVFATV